jgi:ketosteroid isomerase-like protein
VGDSKETIRSLYDSFNAGDLDGMAALVADDAKLALRCLPGAKDDPDYTYSGPAGFIKVAEEARTRFDDYKIKIRMGQFVATDEAVMAGVKITGKDRTTGKKLKKGLGHMWKLRDGQIVHGQVYDRHEDAFKAAGFGTPTKEPRRGSYGWQEKFGRFESDHDFDIELELPEGQVQVFILNYPVPENLTVDLTGPDGPVEMTPNPNTGSGGTDPTTGGSGGIPLARVAYTEIRAPGSHSMLVTGFNSENRRFLMVGREDWLSKKITQR